VAAYLSRRVWICQQNHPDKQRRTPIMSTSLNDYSIVRAAIEARYAPLGHRPRRLSSLEVIRRAHARTDREVQRGAQTR
jgi:hypothetical protein